MKEIYFLRHTTPDIELVYCYGQSDIGLKESFDREAGRTRGQLPEDLSSYKVYSSPLQRCYRLAKKLKQPVIRDDRLKEIYFGRWEMLRWEEIENDPLYKEWRADFAHIPAPQGESFHDMADRMEAFYKDLLAGGEEKFIVVSHGGAIRALLARLIGMPLQNMFQLNIDFGGVTLIEAGASNVKIKFLNR